MGQIDALFRPAAVKNDRLRMLCSCCHPKLNDNAQAALILHLLCGSSAAEIAYARLADETATEKRLARGKAVLAASRNSFDLESEEFDERLPAVQRALHLLFNEGYYGVHASSTTRPDLCKEAIFLVGLLLEHPPARTGTTYGLAALMFLHAARLPARADASDGSFPWNSRIVRNGMWS